VVTPTNQFYQLSKWGVVLLGCNCHLVCLSDVFQALFKPCDWLKRFMKVIFLPLIGWNPFALQTSTEARLMPGSMVQVYTLETYYLAMCEPSLSCCSAWPWQKLV
jgi:hypothetical protein